MYIGWVSIEQWAWPRNWVLAPMSTRYVEVVRSLLVPKAVPPSPPIRPPPWPRVFPPAVAAFLVGFLPIQSCPTSCRHWFHFCHLFHSWEIEIIQNMDLSSTTWLFELAANTAGLSWGAGQGVDRSRLGEKATSLIRRTQHKLLLNDSHVSSITSSLGSLLIFILHVHSYLLPRNKCTDLKSSSARVLLYRNMCRHSIWYRHPWCACYWETFHGFPLAIVNIDEGTLKMWNIFMHLEVSPKFSLWTDSRWKNLKVEKDEAKLEKVWM